VWQNFSLLFNAIDSEKYSGYAICQACKRRYVKLSFYKHDRDQSDTTHSGTVYSSSRQNLCWETIGWDLGVYGWCLGSGFMVKF